MNMKPWKSLVLTMVLSFGAAAALHAVVFVLFFYDRLGVLPAVQTVANNQVDTILTDSRVNKWFTHAAASKQNADAYKAKLAEFICQNTGGPCHYTGPDMVHAHMGRGVTSDAFDAVVQDLVGVLDKLKVPAKEKNDLLAVLGPLKSSIVQK